MRASSGCLSKRPSSRGGVVRRLPKAPLRPWRSGIHRAPVLVKKGGVSTRFSGDVRTQERAGGAFAPPARPLPLQTRAAGPSEVRRPLRERDRDVLRLAAPLDRESDLVAGLLLREERDELVRAGDGLG